MLAVDVMRLLAFAGCSGVVDHRIVGDGGHRIVGDGGPDEKEREDKGCNAHGVVVSGVVSHEREYFWKNG